MHKFNACRSSLKTIMSIILLKEHIQREALSPQLCTSPNYEAFNTRGGGIKTNKKHTTFIYSVSLNTRWERPI